MTNIIAFDFETTGLYPIKDKIVEIGAVRFNPAEWSVIDKFQTFVNPCMPIPQEVTEIHGITDNMVKNAPYEKDALMMLLDYIADSPLIAHKVSFDVGFLMAAASIYKIRPPSNLLIDSCELSRICFRNIENHKLDTLRVVLRLEDSPHHRALGDSYAVMHLYKECLKQLDHKMTLEEIAYRTTNNLKFSDYIFDNIEIPKDKMAIKKAIETSASVEIRYRNGKGEESQRLVTPFNIFGFQNKIYVNAYCYKSDEERQFRLDRICEVITTKT